MAGIEHWIDPFFQEDRQLHFDLVHPLKCELLLSGGNKLVITSLGESRRERWRLLEQLMPVSMNISNTDISQEVQISHSAFKAKFFLRNSSWENPIITNTENGEIAIPVYAIAKPGQTEDDRNLVFFALMHALGRLESAKDPDWITQLTLAQTHLNDQCKSAQKWQKPIAQSQDPKDQFAWEIITHEEKRAAVYALHKMHQLSKQSQSMYPVTNFTSDILYYINENPFIPRFVTSSSYEPTDLSLIPKPYSTTCMLTEDEIVSALSDDTQWFTLQNTQNQISQAKQNRSIFEAISGWLPQGLR